MIAFDREEHEPGIVFIAETILNTKNNSIGALSMTSNTERHSFESLKTHVTTLQTAASKISKAEENLQLPT